MEVSADPNLFVSLFFLREQYIYQMSFLKCCLGADRLAVPSCLRAAKIMRSFVFTAAATASFASCDSEIYGSLFQ